MQNDNTSDTDSETFQFVEETDTNSETCQLVEEMVRDLRQDPMVSEKSHRLWTNFKPVKKIKSTVINRKIYHPVRKNSKTAKSKTAETRRKRTVIFVNQKSMKIKSVQIY